MSLWHNGAMQIKEVAISRAIFGKYILRLECDIQCRSGNAGLLAAQLSAQRSIYCQQQQLLQQPALQHCSGPNSSQTLSYSAVATPRGAR